MIAYSTLAQIGYLFLMFPLAFDPGTARLESGGALTGGMLQAISHATAKAAMFMSAGLIYAALGHDRITGLGGIGRALPMSVVAFALGGVALIGVPPSGAYLAKELLLQAAAETGQWWWDVVIQAGGIFTSSYVLLVLAHALMCARRAGHVTRSRAANAEAAALALAVCSLLLGLFPWEIYLPIPHDTPATRLRPRCCSLRRFGRSWPAACSRSCWGAGGIGQRALRESRFRDCRSSPAHDPRFGRADRAARRRAAAMDGGRLVVPGTGDSLRSGDAWPPGRSRRVRRNRRYSRSVPGFPDNKSEDPSAPCELSADRDNRQHDRHADKCAGNAPQKQPEEHGEQHHERRYRKRGAGNARLQIAADQELDEIEAHEDDQRHLPGFGLRDREQAREDRGNERPDERNVIQRKGNDAPGRREFEPGNQRESPDCDSGQDAHPVRTSMYLRNLAPMSVNAATSARPSSLLLEALELSPGDLHLQQTQQQKNQRRDHKRRKTVRPPGQLLKRPQHPIDVKVFRDQSRRMDAMRVKPQ